MPSTEKETQSSVQSIKVSYVLVRARACVCVFFLEFDTIKVDFCYICAQNAVGP
jgi:hypothetical protein